MKPSVEGGITGLHIFSGFWRPNRWLQVHVDKSSLRPEWALSSLCTAFSQGSALQPGCCYVGNTHSLMAGWWLARGIAPICSHLANSPEGESCPTLWTPGALLGAWNTVSSWVRILSDWKLSWGKMGKDTFSSGYTKDRMSFWEDKNICYIC